MDEPQPKKPGRKTGERHTIGNLRLDLVAATAGKTWLLLPEGFRAREHGHTYPLPVRRSELQRLSAIYIPRHKKDSGCIYLRRAIAQWKHLQQVANSASLDLEYRLRRIQESSANFQTTMKRLQQQAREAKDQVTEEAGMAIASLSQLFDMGRQGLSGMMEAHLKGGEWQGEKVSGAAFRECFRMVTQAVKGLGLPSGQKESAREAILSEVAASLRGTQETLQMQLDPTETDSTH